MFMTVPIYVLRVSFVRLLRLALVSRQRRWLSAPGILWYAGPLCGVAKMNTNSKRHSTVIRHGICGNVQRLLNPERCWNRAGGSFECSEHRVSCHINDPALVRFNNDVT